MPPAQDVQELPDSSKWMASGVGQPQRRFQRERERGKKRGGGDTAIEGSIKLISHLGEVQQWSSEAAWRTDAAKTATRRRTVWQLNYIISCFQSAVSVVNGVKWGGQRAKERGRERERMSVRRGCGGASSAAEKEAASRIKMRRRRWWNADTEPASAVKRIC